ncbi:MAG: PQQ-like beta-propeller repeat protein, partial [Candidatus Bathyarchaeota archaeon]|nr:PQQ-like beta-propeller repeat protein [Candidatus Bathyarchaeota archaeon]
MQNKKLLIALALAVILTVPIIMEASKLTVQALDVPVYLKIHAEPDPVGKGQTVFISLFFTKPIPSGVYQQLTVNLIKPNGQNETFGPYTADTTGGVGGIEYTPTETGNYTVQGFYPGQTIRVSNVDYKILATQSEPETFTVQEEAIPGFPYVPLPTEYWSRPIYSTNFAWAALGGNWWGLYKPSFTDTGGYDATGNNFNPYTTAPNSPHIMWVKPMALGGQPGLPISGDQESQYTSTSILYRQFEPVILNGVIYYKRYTNTPTTETSVETPGWEALDLRTGKTIWKKDTKNTLNFGFLMQFHTIQEYGTQGFLMGSWNSSGLFATGPATNVWGLYDPVTGYFIANITGVPSTTAAGLVDSNDDNTQGAVLIHRVASGNLSMWNSTRCLMTSPSAATIRPSGNIPYSRGIQWEKPIATTLGGNTITPALGIAGRTLEVVLLSSYPAALATFSTQFGEAYAVDAGYDAMTGNLLWGPINRTLPRFHEVPIVATGGDYFVRHDKDTNEAYGYSLTTGKQLWGPVKLPGTGLSTLSRGAAIAYDKVYIWDFGGYVSAIDLATGKIAWTLEPRSAGYDTPYGIYP